MKTKVLLNGILAIMLILLLGTVSTPSTAQDVSSYTFTVEPIGHWHIFDSKTLVFGVYDNSTGDGVEGLNLIAEIARAHSDRVTVRTVDDEQIEEQGNGLYSLEYTPSILDAYALVVRFEQDGSSFASQPVAFETAKAGEEGISAEGNGTTYVYQIRYNWDPGHIHANDEEPVHIIFELIRGIQTGDDINWEQPWTNSFDHVTDAEVVFTLTNAEGETEELTPVYKGRGIYEAEYIFSVEDVGEGQDYTVQCSFTDNFNNAQVELTEPAILHAVPSH